MIKSFTENYKYNLKSELQKKPTFFKNKDGKLEKAHESKWLNYVEWATILVALYKQGAEKVTFNSELHTTKPNTLNIILGIDGNNYTTDYPIIDGNTIIDRPNQMQIHKAELRGFVKCVAIHTGLGIALWQKEESILNEIVPAEKPAERPENTAKFLEFVNLTNDCLTRVDLENLYKSNKTEIEKSKPIMQLFTLRALAIK